MSATALPEKTKPAAARSSARLRWLLLAIGGAMILGCAILQGLWSDRWTDPDADSRDLAARIAKIPLELGDWQGQDLPTTERELRASGAVGHLSRSYRNRVTGQQVSLFLICGHMRNVSVHTPDRCYPAAGFEQLGAPAKFTMQTSAGPVETFTTTFRQEEAAGIQQQRVFWTWGYNDAWQAPDNPRVSFRGVRALYKMYLISAVPHGVEQAAEESPALAFAETELARLNEILFAAPPQSEPAE